MFRPLCALRASAAIAAVGIAIAVPPAAADKPRLEYGLISSFSDQAIGVAVKRAPMGPTPDGTPLAMLVYPAAAAAPAALSGPAPASADLAPAAATQTAAPLGASLAVPAPGPAGRATAADPAPATAPQTS
ncbi:MAG TPA: hypothetical protein VI199_01505, partial [Novosphingobium sp.]